MYAGTVGKLTESAPDPLASWSRYDARPPTLVVERTQGSLNGDGPAAQTGQAAGRVESRTTDITAGLDHDGQPFINVDHQDGVETAVTAWVADVTGSGLVIAESVASDDTVRPFPFDLFTARTGIKCVRQQIDVESLGRTWRNDDVLTDVWMAGDRVGDSVNIRYHSTETSDAANVNIGLGFERTYAGSTYRGIVYESGYLAVWRDCPPGEFLTFVAEEVEPYCERFVPEENQTDFDSFGGG